MKKYIEVLTMNTNIQFLEYLEAYVDSLELFMLTFMLNKKDQQQK